MEKTERDAAQQAEMETLQDPEESLILKLKKPYVFNGITYTELDLSGLEDVTAGTLENVGKIQAKKSPGLNPATLEMTLGFCQLLAARVTKLPLEFYTGLPAKDAVAMKSMVVGFLYGGDGDD